MDAIVDEQTVPSYYYYIDPTSNYTPQQPNPLDDLISVYNLNDLSNQVARTNSDGSKAVKLRKSYKNQISDLSGKFSVIPTKENGKGGELAYIMFQNNADMMNKVHRTKDMTEEQYNKAMINRDTKLFVNDGNNNGGGIDWSLCQTVLSQFERSYPSEFQNQNGFNIDDLAFDLDGTGKSSTTSKKRKNKSNGSSMATPNSDIQEDLKRRRLE